MVDEFELNFCKRSIQWGLLQKKNVQWLKQRESLFMQQPPVLANVEAVGFITDTGDQNALIRKKMDGRLEVQRVHFAVDTSEKVTKRINNLCSVAAQGDSDPAIP